MPIKKENNDEKNPHICGEYFIKGIAILFVIAVLIFAIYWLLITIG